MKIRQAYQWKSILLIALAFISGFFFWTGVSSALDAQDKIAIDLELANKADLGHSHKASDITSGKISEQFIDDAITRDTELAAALAKIKNEIPKQNTTPDVSKGASSKEVENLKQQIKDLEAKVSQLVELLNGVSRKGDDIVFSGVNVQIVNGSGKTDGAVNGRGNLIVGYNELPDRNKAMRNGSHNVVIGNRHNYSSFGGLVVGIANTIAGPYASVSGGYGNTASGAYATVSGGHLNKAEGKYSSVSGGLTRVAKKEHNWCGGEMKSGQ